MFLGDKSPLRLALNAASPFGPLLPGAHISTYSSNDPKSWPVVMEALDFEAPGPSLLTDQTERIGASIALKLFLGLTDCHHENMHHGERDSLLYFCSMDWETVLCELSHPHESGLFRMKRKCACPGNYCQSYGLKKFSGVINPAQVIAGHMSMMKALGSQLGPLNDLLKTELRQRLFHRRLVLRDTLEYGRALQTKDWTDYLPEEIAQLERGEIPYFFHVYGQSEMLYWKAPDSMAVVNASPPNWYRSPMDQFSVPAQLFHDGLLAIARSLDPATPVANFSFGKFRVSYRPNLVLVDAPAGRFFEKRFT